MTNLSAALKCAGQSCDQRKDCLRYELHKDPYTRDTWASFDIEQQKLGDCVHRLTFTGGNSYVRRA
jgi:hypothetical protein